MLTDGAHQRSQSGSALATGEDLILVERGGAPLATVTLNRSSTRNAINRAMWQEIGGIFTELGQDDTIRAVILRAIGYDAFSSGADLHELLHIASDDRTAGDDRAAKDYWRLVDYANSAIETCPKPVIAMINHCAYGAGCALALACDLRIAATNAKIGVPSAPRGLTLGLSDTRRLVSAVGASYAKAILIEGKIYDADEAHHIGLLNKVVPVEKLEEETVAFAHRLVVENAPRAMREAKANILAVIRNPSFAAIDETTMPIAWAGSRDLEEGIMAFLEGRKPSFTGE